MTNAGRAPADDWESHWRSYAASAEENPAQWMRQRLILQLLQLSSGGPHRIIDAGSGQGDLVALLVKDPSAPQVVGLEMSSSGIDAAQRKTPTARFVQRDLSVYEPVSDELRGWATRVVCSEVLEHVDDPVTFVRHLTQYCEDRCRLVITVPGGPMSAFDRHIGHRAHFTRARLRQTLGDAGLEVEQVVGAGFPFFTLYRLAVIARGERLAADVAEGGGAPASRLSRMAMTVFDRLLRLNMPPGRLGWQMIAVARVRSRA